MQFFGIASGAMILVIFKAYLHIFRDPQGVISVPVLFRSLKLLVVGDDMSAWGKFYSGSTVKPL